MTRLRLAKTGLGLKVFKTLKTLKPNIFKTPQTNESMGILVVTIRTWKHGDCDTLTCRAVGRGIFGIKIAPPAGTDL